ncbi:MAG: flagellar hook-basal body protein FliE [Rhodospirillales bacterium]|jgi:flagellar hook-basal body complex protein FliE|nr:flagellar hook-basal body protein FliE [Rhodospirillales bacterium]
MAVVGITGAVNAYQASIQRLADGAGGAAKASPASAVSGDFSSMVKSFAEDAVKSGQHAENQTAAAAAGKADLNSVVMAVSEAELTLNTVVAVRDKVIEAYREILRMPI